MEEVATCMQKGGDLPSSPHTPRALGIRVSRGQTCCSQPLGTECGTASQEARAQGPLEGLQAELAGQGAGSWEGRGRQGR